MLATNRILGQSNPAATTLTDLYVVPAVTTTLATALFVANRSATATTFRISAAIAGAADNLKQYTHYDVPIVGNDSFSLDISFALSAGDIVRCYAGSATLSFNLFGVENA